MSDATRQLIGLTIGDDPDAWRALGFTVDGDRLTLDRVTLLFVGPGEGRGLRAWSLDPPLHQGLDGIAHQPAPTAVPEQSHPNGAVAVDHVVAWTPDMDRTVAALAEVGLHPRRRATGLQGGDRTYAFFVLGTCLLEVIGPAVHDPGRTPAPAALVGLALTATDLDRVAALDGVAGIPRDAIQPGRRIVTLRTHEVGVSVPVALLTPRS